MPESPVDVFRRGFMHNVELLVGLNRHPGPLEEALDAPRMWKEERRKIERGKEKGGISRSARKEDGPWSGKRCQRGHFPIEKRGGH